MDCGASTSNENNKGPNVYATINDGYATDEETQHSYNSQICEKNFLEEIYTSLKADRQKSIYASLCKPDDYLEELPGIDSTDQDYVFL